ncbi:hypothetical protein DPMN_192026 [Dreissena polymorpha]|uniref:Uncharacterized protein n=1 Tax=Dreissena polymorpha TaxID=45954 RepID=A0A9D3Y1I6_DREPO|nr:hypothetical protein DPMN_192026 [Dreissena polymorpha]
MYVCCSRLCTGNITLRHTTVRQAVVGIQGNGSNIHISNSEIYSCVQGLLLSGGVSKVQRESYLGPILSKTKVMHNEKGARVHAIVGQEFIFFDATYFDFNSYGVEVVNWAGINDGIVSSSLHFTNVFMSNNTNYGLVINIDTPLVIDIRGSTFIGNRRGGIYFFIPWRHKAHEISITDTIFEDTNTGIRYDCHECNTSNMTIVGNKFDKLNCALYIIFLTRFTAQLARGNITIANNAYTGNERDIVMTVNSLHELHIVRNLFYGTQEAIAIKNTTSTDTNIPIMIFENSFVNLVRGFTAVSLSFVKTIISMNRFYNCSSTTLVGLQNGFDHLIANNTFVNSTESICYVQTKQSYTKGKAISASFNYWDTSDIFAVKSKVCDFFVDSSKAVIDVTGFYEDSSMTKLNFSETIDLFRSAINPTTHVAYIGEIVDGDKDISNLGVSRLILNRSLLIKEGVTLRF